MAFMWFGRNPHLGDIYLNAVSHCLIFVTLKVSKGVLNVKPYQSAQLYSQCLCFCLIK